MKNKSAILIVDEVCYYYCRIHYIYDDSFQ